MIIRVPLTRLRNPGSPPLRFTLTTVPLGISISIRPTPSGTLTSMMLPGECLRGGGDAFNARGSPVWGRITSRSTRSPPFLMSPHYPLCLFLILTRMRIRAKAATPPQRRMYPLIGDLKGMGPNSTFTLMVLPGPSPERSHSPSPGGSE